MTPYEMNAATWSHTVRDFTVVVGVMVLVGFLIVLLLMLCPRKPRGVDEER